MLHGILPEEILKYSSSTFLAPGWSLSLEWQFYTLAPAIVTLIANRMFGGAALVISVLALVWGLAQLTGYHWKYPSLLPIAMPHFLIGITCRLLITETRLPRFYWAAIVLAAAIFSDWLAVLIWVVFYIIILSEADKVKLPAVFGGVMRLLVHNSVITNLGKWSYSTYLIHIPLFSLIVGGYAMLSEGEVSQTAVGLLTVVAVLLTIPVSYLLYEKVEKPFINIGNSLVRRRWEE